MEVRDVPGGVEAVLAEAHGTGAITWIHSANPSGTLVLEVDGNVIEQAFAGFLKGTWLPMCSPFATKTAEGSKPLRLVVGWGRPDHLVGFNQPARLARHGGLLCFRLVFQVRVPASMAWATSRHIRGDGRRNGCDGWFVLTVSMKALNDSR